MGCSPSKSAVVVTVEQACCAVPNTPTTEDHSLKNARLHVVQPRLQYEVNSTIPHGFHPPNKESELELQCQATVHGLAPKESEILHRGEVKLILEEWEKSLQLTEIENHALSVPPDRTANVKALASSLTSSRAKYVSSVCDNAFHLQLAKAYAIYFWVAVNITYDVATWQTYLNEDVAMKVDAKTVLQRRSAVCLGYAKLFQALAMEAGLQVEVITGYVRLWRLLSHGGPNSRFEPNRETTHDWSVVKIGGVWFPLDCTYGSGYVGPQMQFTARFSRAYFAVSPEKLILTHLPSDEAWQLLQHPVTARDLQPLIAPQVQVFPLGIEPRTWCESMYVSVDASDPVVSIRLKAKPGLRLSIKIIDNDSLEMQGVQKLDTRSSQGSYHVEQHEIDTSISVVVPHKGRFTVVIHAYNPGTVVQNGSQQRYQLCLTYQVTCDLDFRQSPVGYPVVNELVASAFGFRLLHWNLPQKSYVQENTQGRLEVIFRAQPGLKYFHCLVPGRGKSLESKPPTNAHSFSTMVLHDCNDSSLHSLRVVFPSEGWWTLFLCATQAASINGSTTGYTSLLSYPVLAKASRPKQTYPRLLSSEPVFFESSEPITASGTTVLAVPFTCAKQLDFHCYMSHESPTGEAVKEYTRVESHDSERAQPVATFKYILRVTFPKPGKWYVNVLAKESHDTAAESFSGLFGLCLEVEGAALKSVFPSVNKPVADELGIQLLDNDPVSFDDDAKPFVFEFLAPRDISFMPKLKPCPHPEGTDGSDSSYVEHCTLLLLSGTASSPTYTLKVIFPSAGKWQVMLFAGKPKSEQYSLAIQINLKVTTPMPGIAYPKLFSAFHNLGLTIPPENEQYSTSLASPEFKLPFYGKGNLHLVWDMQFASSGEKFYRNAFVHYPTKEDPMYVLHLVFPKPGEWIVQLVAKTAEINDINSSVDTNENYQSIMILRLTALECTESQAFPQVFQSFTSTFGLSIQRDVLPLISRVRNFPRSVVIPFYNPAKVKFWHEVELEGKGNQVATRLTSDPSTQLHQLEVEVTESGVWTVMLYARHSETEEDSWTAVLCHVIHVGSET